MQNIQNIFICFILVSFSLLLSYKEYKKNNRIINVISLFSIGFILPFAISFLKLSKLSSEYDTRTIILVVGSFLSFYYGVKCSEKWDIRKVFFGSSKKNISNKSKKSIYDYLVDIYNFIIDNFNARNVIIIIFVISFVSFLIEVAVLRFIPLFSFGTPHAYSTFHIFGIHYITTLYFLMPALAILNLSDGAHIVRPYEKGAHTVRPYDVGVSSRARTKKVVKNNVWANFVSPRILMIFSVVYAVAMSLLLVSRALLIMTVVMAGLAYVMRAHIVRPYEKVAHTVRPYAAVVAIICFIGLYISITILRSHSVSYLNDIFEMKENTPIFITQPYMYLTQGFENLNYLVTHNERFTFGRRTLAPLFSLLRTKKYFPLVTEAPFYQIKLELTSKPIIYDLYYDFSMIGTFIIMFIIGYVVKKIEIKNYREDNIYYNLFFGLICYYLIFSFFQSYLSLLDTWFYLIFTYLLYIISELKKAKK